MINTDISSPRLTVLSLGDTRRAEQLILFLMCSMKRVDCGLCSVTNTTLPLLRSMLTPRMIWLQPHIFCRISASRRKYGSPPQFRKHLSQNDLYSHLKNYKTSTPKKH